MADSELADFRIQHELINRDERRVFEAFRGDSVEPVRLTVFTAKISQRPEFRRALKTDRAMLSMLQHQSIVRFLGDGESEGALFFWTGACESEPLSSPNSSHRRFSTEDVIEIGWQICSALQQAHNLGLSHGGLSVDSILLSVNLQVTVIDFGVERWLKAARQSRDETTFGPSLITISALVSRQEVEQDLSDLADVLTHLLLRVESGGTETDDNRASTRLLLERLLVRASTGAAPAQRPVSAREFQGRLGEILIGADDDVMPLVDQRNAAATSRRSIVVELFEPDAMLLPMPGARHAPATPAWRRQILPIAAVIAVLVIVTLLAGWLF